MSEIITALGTVAGMALIAVARDIRDGKSIFRKNGTAESNRAIKEIQASQAQLLSHFNHDTTELLTDIRKEMREHNKMEYEVQQLLREQKEYGVKIRP